MNGRKSKNRRKCNAIIKKKRGRIKITEIVRKKREKKNIKLCDVSTTETLKDELEELIRKKLHLIKKIKGTFGTENNDKVGVWS